MAWTNPATVAAGDTLAAAFWNEQVRDNTADLRSYQNRYAIARRTAGNLTLNSTSWANVDTGLDLTLGASAGDVIEVSYSGIWNSEAVQAHLDVVTIVGGVVTNSLATGGAINATGEGIVAWSGWGGALTAVGGNFYYTLVSGDISGGNVTLRLRYRTLAATNKILIANTTANAVFFARNLGPVTT